MYPTTILISKHEKHEFDVSTFVDLYHRARSKNWVVNFTAEVTFLNFFAKAKGIMYFIHPCKELVIPWANFFNPAIMRQLRSTLVARFSSNFYKNGILVQNLLRKYQSMLWSIQSSLHIWCSFNFSSHETERTFFHKGVKTLQHSRKSGNSIC